jgi:hypothetical protein
MSYFDRMIDAVGDLDFTDDPVDEFANGAFVILAAALARLPEWKREAWLTKIEDGDLRRAAPRFFDSGALPLPRANGNGRAAEY